MCRGETEAVEPFGLAGFRRQPAKIKKRLRRREDRGRERRVRAGADYHLLRQKASYQR